ncbi:MAG TPA: hypothetical protein VNP94_08305 [Actinomycetota bacterium]|nr:hypothetical protein [Actinomycetota bacterium]
MACGHPGCTCGGRGIADRSEAGHAHGCGGHGSGGCCGDHAEPAPRETDDEIGEDRPAVA